jgi:hypothetical protein
MQAFFSFSSLFFAENTEDIQHQGVKKPRFLAGFLFISYLLS